MSVPAGILYPNVITERLGRLGIDLLGARNTALQSLVVEAPPPLVAELLGYSYNTTQRHAEIAAQPWARYVTNNSRRIELTRDLIQSVLQRLSAIAATQQQTGRRLRKVTTSTLPRAWY